MAFNTIIDTIAPALADLELLSDDDLDKARKLHERARDYLTLARSSEQAVARKINAAADRLAADPKVTEDKVIAATIGLPDARAVTSIAEQLERNLDRQAQSIVLARAGEAVGRLNARLNEIADETATVAEDLANIDTPQAAIDAGAVESWRRAQTLIAEYQDIASLAYQLRELRIIPRPRSSQSGAHWMYLEQGEDWLPKDPTPWQKHVVAMKKRPWVPASADEAEAVFAQWSREAATA